MRISIVTIELGYSSLHGRISQQTYLDHCECLDGAEADEKLRSLWSFAG